MQEILVMRSDTEGRTRLKIFQVDDSALSKLTRIRGNFYQDNPRLIPLKDMPTSSPAPVYSQAAIEATEKAFMLYKLSKVTTSPHVIEPEPQKSMTFEEQIQHDWKHSPDIRAEFVSFTSYSAYMRAVRDGRAKVCGRG